MAYYFGEFVRPTCTCLPYLINLLTLVAHHYPSYTIFMIERYKSEDAFSATEDFLLVPVPIDEVEITGGFAGEVFRRFSLASVRLHEKGGLSEAEVLIIGRLGREQRWIPAYSIALAGIHRQQSHGWNDTPARLEAALDTIAAKNTQSHLPNTLATAGIPGTGFSGLRGDASPEEIKQTLEAHSLLVTVYQNDVAGDRAALLEATPPELDRIEITGS